ncbi:RHS repeat-associated core domain-containing protein [Arthrobacter tecti]
MDSWANYDEYGNNTSTTPNTGLTTYAWHGAAQRALDNSGLVLMGARLYNPTTGLFTSRDPITGGNTTSYTYPQDPINKSDTTGLAFWFIPILVRVAWVACKRYCASAGKAIYNTFKRAAPKVKHYANKNPYIRYGNQPSGIRRFSMGATTKHWNKSGPIRRQFTRFHLHVERHKWDFHVNTRSGPRFHRHGGKNWK